MRQSKKSKLELRGLLIGVVLGDGSLSKPTSKSNSSLLIGHSIKQKEYCIFKLNLISNLLRTKSTSKEYNVLNKKTNKHYPIFQGKVNVHRYLTKLRKILYPDDKKKIDVKVLNYLTPEGLAYWYMDDGGVITYHKRKKIDGIFISTQCFTYEEHLIIKDYFKTKWNIDCKIGKHGKGKFRIAFNKTNANKFLNLIEKYKHQDLDYKFCLNYDEYLNKFNSLQKS